MPIPVSTISKRTRTSVDCSSTRPSRTAAWPSSVNLTAIDRESVVAAAGGRPPRKETSTRPMGGADCAPYPGDLGTCARSRRSAGKSSDRRVACGRSRAGRGTVGVTCPRPSHEGSEVLDSLRRRTTCPRRRAGGSLERNCRRSSRAARTPSWSSPETAGFATPSPALEGLIGGRARGKELSRRGAPRPRTSPRCRRAVATALDGNASSALRRAPAARGRRLACVRGQPPDRSSPDPARAGGAAPGGGEAGGDGVGPGTRSPASPAGRCSSSAFRGRCAGAAAGRLRLRGDDPGTGRAQARQRRPRTRGTAISCSRPWARGWPLPCAPATWWPGPGATRS